MDLPVQQPTIVKPIELHLTQYLVHHAFRWVASQHVKKVYSTLGSLLLTQDANAEVHVTLCPFLRELPPGHSAD